MVVVGALSHVVVVVVQAAVAAVADVDALDLFVVVDDGVVAGVVVAGSPWNWQFPPRLGCSHHHQT